MLTTALDWPESEGLRKAMMLCTGLYGFALKKIFEWVDLMTVERFSFYAVIGAKLPIEL